MLSPILPWPCSPRSSRLSLWGTPTLKHIQLKASKKPGRPSGGPGGQLRAQTGLRLRRACIRRLSGACGASQAGAAKLGYLARPRSFHTTVPRTWVEVSDRRNTLHPEPEISRSHLKDLPNLLTLGALSWTKRDTSSLIKSKKHAEPPVGGARSWRSSRRRP